VEPKPRVLIVLATYNERENIERMLPVLLKLPLEAGIIVVDDASPDGTSDIVRQAAEADPGRVVLISRPGKLGYGSAFVAGFRRALETEADVIVSMDADFSHAPRSVPSLVKRLSDADMAIGSRYVGGMRILNWSMRRLLLSFGANTYINAILRFGLTDCTSGFRAYRAEVLRGIDLDRAASRGYAFLVEILEMAHRQNRHIVEEPIVYTERQRGRSKMSRGVITEAIVRPWQLLWRRLLGRG
jgi:dolichol-phosphate mannosyltransferase